MAQIEEHPSRLRGGNATKGNEAGEASGVHNQSATDTDTERWIKSVVGARGGQAEDRKSKKIYKVPAMLRANEDLELHYNPRVVSIGPYHHKTPQLRNHEIKCEMARELAKSAAPPSSSNVQDGAIEKKIKGWFDKIMAKINEWRECYPDMEEQQIGNDELGRMLLLDGCFIVYYIDNYINITKDAKNRNEQFFKILKMKSLQVITVKQDLFLLENQIPFEVLETLLEEDRARASQWKTCLWKFINHEILQRKSEPTTPKFNTPSHLLDLLRSMLVPTHTQGSAAGSGRVQGQRQHDGNNKPSNGSGWHSFRNVKELNEVGIWLKPSEGSYCLKDVSFEPGLLGYLRLPPMVVDDSTAAKFLNLIAYEMCPGGPADSTVTSYICFMESLIDQAEDVRAMRKAGVLRNFLGSDKEVADLFNKIATDLVPDEDIYEKVKGKIQRHYDSTIKAWAATFVHTHFSTPWTVAAFVAAIYALILSSISTYHGLFR